MARTDQPAFLGSPAFWNFLADQQAEPVLQRLHEQVGSALQRQSIARSDRSSSYRAV